MGKGFFEASSAVRKLFSLASDVTGYDMKKILFESSEDELKRTENSQSAITLMNLSVALFLEEQGILSSAAAGFSLGEYSALVEAGILSAETVFPLVIERGRIMGEAVQENSKLAAGSAMAAVIGIDGATIDEVLAEEDDIYPANYNAPLQTVISGTMAALDKVSEALKKAGARRIIPLKVSGPFHTPLMKDAREKFSQILENCSFNDPVKPVYSNVTGKRIENGASARELCKEQITAPVRWTALEESLRDDGYHAMVESGPGKVLSGLWKSGPGTVLCLNTDSPENTLQTVQTITEK
jgi:[acyl-carrier-protein] S-malonyltransferase